MLRKELRKKKLELMNGDVELEDDKKDTEKMDPEQVKLEEK
jgi:serine/threonine protein kinase